MSEPFDETADLRPVIVVNDRLAIPAAELEFRFSRSSGPGGQHVQRSDTRVELLYNVATSPSLTDEQRGAHPCPPGQPDRRGGCAAGSELGYSQPA